MTKIAELDDFLTKAQVFFLASVDENGAPKCRPLGMHLVINDKLYFGVGTFKEVYKQLQANPHVEICACVGYQFIRYYGKVVFEQDYTVAEAALEAVPVLKNIYNETTGNKLGMFYLENATVEYREGNDLQAKYSL